MNSSSVRCARAINDMKGGAWEGGAHVELRDIKWSAKTDFKELIEYFEGRAYLGVRITEIFTYTTPITEWQYTDLLFYHEFVVFKAGRKWWSVEKHGDRIRIQRGETQNSVKENIRGNKRLKGLSWEVKQNLSGTGTKTVRQCMQALDEMKYDTSTYHVITKNCQGFAKRLFTCLTKGAWIGDVYVWLKDINWSTCMDLDELMKQLQGRAVLGTNIIEVATYTAPLSEGQSPNFPFPLYNEIVVFKAKKKWWLIKKHVDTITIQRGGTLSSVKEHIIGETELKGLSWEPEPHLCGTGARTVRECMQVLKEMKDDTLTYYYLTNNFQDFAKRLSTYLKGGAWDGGIYVELLDIKWSTCICQDELTERLELRADLSARITKLCTYYTDSLSEYEFVVFKAGGKWWSIEKHTDRVTIQRGDTQSSVKDYLRGENRMKGTSLVVMLHLRCMNMRTYIKTVRQCLQALEQIKEDSQVFAKSLVTYLMGGIWIGGVLVELIDIRWSTCIYFDELIEQLEGRADLSARITEISTFTTPLYEWKWADLLFYHEFVVFKAGGKWWSVEKHADRITIQRGDTQSSVKDYIRRDKRLEGTSLTVKKHRSGTGTKTVLQCMQALKRMKDDTSSYRFFTSNCQGFAKRLFTELTT